MKSVQQQIKCYSKIWYNRNLIQKLVQQLNKHPGKIIDSDTYQDLTYLNSKIHSKLITEYTAVLNRLFDIKKTNGTNNGTPRKLKPGWQTDWYLLRNIIRLENVDDQKRALRKMLGWNHGNKSIWQKTIAVCELLRLKPEIIDTNNLQHCCVCISPTTNNSITLYYDFSDEKRGFLLRTDSSLDGPARWILSSAQDYVQDFKRYLNQIDAYYRIRNIGSVNNELVGKLQSAENTQLLGYCVRFGPDEIDELSRTTYAETSHWKSIKANLEVISTRGNWVVIYNKRIAQVETFEAIGNCK